MNLSKKTMLGMASVLCAVPVFGAKKKDAPKKDPNVLVILCDQQRFDCLGFNGNEMVNTPNIDAIARKGMNFTRAYTPIPTSCPARQSLVSGLWPEVHEGLWNYDNSLPVRLFDKDTWTERLNEKGYNMGYIGKWHVNPVKSPLDFGFDDYIFGRDYNKWCRDNKIKEEKVLHIDDNKMMGGYSTLDKDDARIHWYARQCIELIKKYEKEGKPWHIRLDYLEPHLPCFPVKEFYEKYADMQIPAWENFYDSLQGKPYIQLQQLYNWGIEEYGWEQWQQYLRSYFAVIEQIDDAIGLVMDELKKMHLLDDTIIIYTADHGDAGGCHRMIDKHYVMYEEEVHVPLVIRWDNVIEPGSECDEFVIHSLDLAATMSDLFELDHPTQGRSLLPLMKGEKVSDWRQYAFSNYNGQQFGLFVQRMVRDDRYKYVWNPTDTDEFYDLEVDPFEKQNCIRDERYQDEIKRLRKVLYEDLVKRNDPIVGKPTAADRQLLHNQKH